MPNLSPIYELCHSSWQRRMLNLPSEARDQTHILMDIQCILKPLDPKGHSQPLFLKTPSLMPSSVHNLNDLDQFSSMCDRSLKVFSERGLGFSMGRNDAPF